MPLRTIRTALLVYKKSAWDQHDAGKAGAVADAPTRRTMLRAHHDNARAMVEVKRALDEAGIHHRATARWELVQPRPNGDGPDLVISVGGDGTFLAASHQVGDGLIVGVNSSPDHSVGFFCAATRETFAGVLAGILRGRTPVTLLHRLQITVNGRKLPQLALNDALITHRNPGATSRYALKVGAREEVQRSSGLWISTAAGSTAGIRAAGGQVLPVKSDRLQYAVRELYVPPGDKPFKLHHGLAPRRSEIRVVCRMVEGALFVDGPRHSVDLHIGDRVQVKVAPRPLHVLGLDARRGR